MLNKILKIEGTNSVSKLDQKEVNGGIRTIPMCSESCANASSGTACGPPHCPGVCTGNGGWVNY